MKFLLRTGFVVIPLLNKIEKESYKYKKYVDDIKKGVLQKELFHQLLEVDKNTITDFTNKDTGSTKIRELVDAAFETLDNKLKGKQPKQTVEFSQETILARVSNLNHRLVDLSLYNDILVTIVTLPLPSNQCWGPHLLDADKRNTMTSLISLT